MKSADTVDDPLFGLLSWDKEMHEWGGRASMSSGVDYSLHLTTGAENMLHPFTDADVCRTITPLSRQAFARLADLDGLAREGLASEYVPVYAEWHKKSIPPPDFKARLQLESARIKSDGSVDLSFADNDMFHGHFLIAWFDPGGNMVYAEMFG